MVVKPVGDEDMKQFCRPDPIKHRLAGLRHPFVIDRRRQRLASRHRGAQRRQVGAILHRRQHYAIGGWRSETDCRPILLDHLDEIGRRSGLEQYRSGPEAKGKDRQAAETEGEGKGRRADKNIIGRYTEHFVGISVGDDHQVSVEMHRTLGFSRRAGGESDQGDIIRRRQHRLQTNGLVQSETVELGIVVRRTVKPNDGLQPFALFSACLLYTSDAADE